MTAPTNDLANVVEGWRIWLTNPADPTSLHSPFTYADDYGYGPIWENGRMAHARCPFPHTPPDPGCQCGLYAGTSVVDAIYRMRQAALAIRAALRWTAPVGTLPILARVLMLRPRASMWWGREPTGVLFPVPELRSAAVCVEQLYVAGDICPHWIAGSPLLCRQCPAASRIAEQLTGAFGVHATPHLPAYTAGDWESRPQWHLRGAPELADPSTPGTPRWLTGRQMGPRLPTAIWTAPVPDPGQSVAGEAVSCRFMKRKDHQANDETIIAEFVAALEELPVGEHGIAHDYDLAEVSRISMLDLEINRILDDGGHVPELPRRLAESTRQLIDHFYSRKPPGVRVVREWLAAREETL